VQLISKETRDFGIPTYLNLEASDEYYFMGYGVSAAIGKPAVGAQKIRHAQALNPKLKIEIWLSGGLTPKTKQYVEGKGMVVHENAFATLLHTAKEGSAK
jgi:hypothetical protein